MTTTKRVRYAPTFFTGLFGNFSQNFVIPKIALKSPETTQKLNKTPFFFNEGFPKGVGSFQLLEYHILGEEGG